MLIDKTRKYLTQHLHILPLRFQNDILQNNKVKLSVILCSNDDLGVSISFIDTENTNKQMLLITSLMNPANTALSQSLTGDETGAW